MKATTWRQPATANLVRPATADRDRRPDRSRAAPCGTRLALLASTAAVLSVVGAGAASAAPVFTQGGDASFRNITASGGTLAGVDVSNATVLVNGTSMALTALALQAAQAVPASMAGQPNGWLKLDGNGMVPTSTLPPSASGVDQAARSAAAAAQSLAAAAEPAAMAGKTGGWAPLDANALVPVASLPSSVTNPVDSSARSAAAAAQSAANAAQALAAAAMPAANANKAGGFPQLDSNALVPVAALPAAYTASSAIAMSTLGQANGPARLDATGSLSGNMAAATTSAVQRSLAAHFADVVNAADYGMKCDYQTLGDLTTTQGSVVVSSASYSFTQADVGRNFVGGYGLGQNGTVTIVSVNQNGSANISSAAPQSRSGSGYANLWTDDTTALKSAVAVATARLGGADLVIPGGECELSGEIDVADSTSLRIRGEGDQATNLNWNSQTNGLIVTETNQASLTIGDFMISKRAGTNGSTTFIGTALSVGGAPNATGENKIGDITIIGSSPAGQIDGWNQGLVENNLAHSYTSHVTVLQPGPVIPSSGTPSPLAPTATEPAANAFGVAADVVLEGTGGGFYIDGALDGITTTGGDVSLDAQAIQGAYITNTKLTYANFGLRVDSPNTTSELVNFSNSYVIANLLDLYLNGVGDSQITGNMFWPNGGNAPAWAGVWLRNTNSDEVTGNGFLGHVGTTSIDDFGLYVSSDGGAGYPHALIGNTLYYMHGTAISNASGTSGVEAMGNVIVAATIATSDPNYGATNGTGNGPAVATGGMGNLYFGNILNGLTAMSDDGQRNIQFAKNLTCGNTYDPCTFTVKSTGTNVFQVDPSGNVTATGALSDGSMAGHATVFVSEASYGNATMTTNQGTPSTTTLGPLLTGLERIRGTLTCINGSAVALIDFDGLWGGSTFGPVAGHFALTSGDGSAIPSGWSVTPGAMAGATGTPATSGYPELTLTGAPSPTDCSAHLEETAVQ